MTSKETQRPQPKPCCEVCRGSFGLIRHRSAFKQFCSKRCLDQYLATRKHSFGLKSWTECVFRKFPDRISVNHGRLLKMKSC